MKKYSKVRFIGFAIPTTPASVVGVGNVDGSGMVAGTYPALPSATDDISARIEVMQAGVDAAFASLKDTDPDADVLNIFVAPEFFWHSDIGPYVYSSDEDDPAEIIMSELQSRFTSEKYPNTLFVLGTVISAQVDDLDVILNDSTVVQRNNVVKALGEAWSKSVGAIQDAVLSMLIDFIKVGHAYPKVEVRNRALIIGPTPLQSVDGSMSAAALTTEKYFASNEDFLLWDVTGKPVITEQTVAYRSIDLSGGDLKQKPGDPKAIFSVEDGPIVGVEICLDHSDHRLRHSSLQSPWPKSGQGVDIHVVPSCGMQLHPASVAAISHGLAFNCDGLYALGAEPGKAISSTVGGVAGLHVDYTYGSDTTYSAHSQLTRVVTGPVEADAALPGAQNATFDTPQVDVRIVPVPATADLDQVFAGGPGAIHIYGASEPLAMETL